MLDKKEKKKKDNRLNEDESKMILAVNSCYCGFKAVLEKQFSDPTSQNHHKTHNPYPTSLVFDTNQGSGTIYFDIRAQDSSKNIQIKMS